MGISPHGTSTMGPQHAVQGTLTRGAIDLIKTHYYPKYEIWTIENKLVNNPFKSQKGLLLTKRQPNPKIGPPGSDANKRNNCYMSECTDVPRHPCYYEVWMEFVWWSVWWPWNGSQFCICPSDQIPYLISGYDAKWDILDAHNLKGKVLQFWKW